MMKKVLIICGALRIGGAEKVAYQIGLYRDRTEYRTDYVVFGDEVGEYEQELLDSGCLIFHVPSPGNSYRQFVHNIRSLIRDHHYDVVHCHTMFSSGWVLHVAKREGVPVRIAHSHTIRSKKNMGFVKEIYQSLMRQLIRMDATDFAACGKDAGSWLYGKRFFEKHGVLILNGINVKEFRYSPECRTKIRESLHIGNDTLVIGHAGHMFAVKNQIFLIRLMPEILKEREDTVLLLLGDGEDREMLKEEVKTLGIEDHVVMTGNVSNVNEFLSAMDVFAFPSLYEGMPLSMIEVQSNGLPCIISERVPDDVFLTDLLIRTDLNERDVWRQRLLNTGRNNPDYYNGYMMESGFDSSAMLKKVYSLYEKDTVRP